MKPGAWLAIFTSRGATPTASVRPTDGDTDEVLPEIRPGAWAAWAGRTSSADDAVPIETASEPAAHAAPPRSTSAEAPAV